MGEERELREDQAERTRHEQLEPRVAEQDEAGDRTAEGEREPRDEGEIEPPRAVQEAGFANDPGEGGVAPRGVSGTGAGLRRPNRTE